jgi:hypothetical protein
VPAGWTVSATQYDISRKTMSLLGPVVDETTGAQGVVYATISCFPTGAEESVTRAEQAARDAGQTVTDRADLGDQAFSGMDDSGAEFLQLRHGPIVVYLAASGDATAQEVDQLASAFDKALGGDGGAISLATPGASQDVGSAIEPVPSDVVAESPAAPELEASLPTTVGAITLTADSATGSLILGDDTGSRAILAALRADGLDADALKVAQAYDVAGASDLTITALSIDGMDLAQVKDLAIASWLSASGAGVTRTPVKLAGQEWTRVDYGDGGAMDYVRAADGIVHIITTPDAALAAQAAAAMP